MTDYAHVKNLLHSFLDIVVSRYDFMAQTLFCVQNNWIKKWKKCINLVNRAEKHRQLHLRFRRLLAQCDRDANTRVGGVAGNSSTTITRRTSSSGSNKRRRSSASSGVTGRPAVSLQHLHREMASLVRGKLIEQAIADVKTVERSVQQLKAKGDTAGATQKENLRVQLMQHRDRLQKTNLGWQMAWGVVDRALAGMEFFRGNLHLPFPHCPPPPQSRNSAMCIGDDEAAMLRCFHDVQDLFGAGTLS